MAVFRFPTCSRDFSCALFPGKPSSGGGREPRRAAAAVSIFFSVSRARLFRPPLALSLSHRLRPEPLPFFSQLFWPDDGMWYKAEVVSLNLRARSAKVLYATGDVETLAIDEIAAEGHLNVCA